MKKAWLMTILAAALAFAVSTGFGAEQQKEAGEPAAALKKQEPPAKEKQHIMLRVPLLSDRFSSVPLALVNDEPIRLRDLVGALAAAHEEKHGEKEQAPKVDYGLILHRLIIVKLIVQDGKTMGMDELSEITAEVDAFSKIALREVLIDEVVKDVQAPEEEVQKLYRERVREWKIKSVMFAKEDDAKKMDGDIRSGRNFDEAVTVVLDEKLAEGSKDGGYVKPDALQPEIAAAVAKLEVGAVSTVITIDRGQQGPGYVILKLEEVRYPDNAEAKERAEKAVRAARRNFAVDRFRADLIKKYAKINSSRINAMDFESSKPGLEKLRKDKRVLVEIKKGKSITVADVADMIAKRYYHGAEMAIQAKKVNKYKVAIIGEILENRLYRDEALRRGLDKSEEYKSRVRDYEDSLIFGNYINKVVVPNIKITDEDLKTYYEGHKKDFTYPEMMRVDSLVFGKLKDAESALAQLKQGADLKWMKSNSEGQVPKETPGLEHFEGNVIIVEQMPKGAQKSLAGAAPNDVRLYESPEGHFYVLYVIDVSPSREQPFEEVRGIVYNKLFESKLQESMEDWGEKLKAAGTVDVYLAGQDKDTDTSKAK